MVGVAIGVSPDIYPPLKISVVSTRGSPPRRGISTREGDRIEGSGIDLSRSTREITMKLGDLVGSMEMVVWLPRVMSSVVALPFDQVFQAIVAHATVQHLLDFKLLFAVHQDWIGWWGCTTSWNGIGHSRGQLCDREDIVEGVQRSGEIQFVGAIANLCNDRNRPHTAVR
jgi:hypothetical protein